MDQEGGNEAAAEARRKAALRAALVAYYEKHNPAQLADALLDEIVAKYYGKEGQLAGKLQKRYGEAPRISNLAQRPLSGAQANGGKTQQGAAISSAPQTAAARAAAAAAAPAAAADARARADLTSPHFDAFFALTRADDKDVTLPALEREAPPLDNLSRCRHLLPPTEPEYVAPAPTDPATAAAVRREVKAAAEAAAKARAGPPVVEALAEGLKAGPLALLHRCFRERWPVCVMVRRIDGVRGTLTGQLRAFDRHFNMVLGEAIEVFALPSSRPLPPGGNRGKQQPRAEQRKRGCRAGKRRKTQGRRRPMDGGEEDGGVVEGVAASAAAGEQGQAATAPQPLVRQRQLPQVLVRGDNVVMIWEARHGCITHAIPSAVAMAPATSGRTAGRGGAKRSASPGVGGRGGGVDNKRRRVERTERGEEEA